MAKMQIIKHPIEQIGNNVKKSAWSASAESLITIALGILLIIWPETVIQILAYIIGVFFIIKGGYQIANYFIVKGQRDFFNNDLLFGVISLLVGITALILGEDLASVFRIVIGIWVIYEALTRINIATKLAAAEINSWRYVLVLAILMLILGFIITFTEGAVTVIVGWMMIATGFIGIVGDVMFIQHINQIIDKVTK